MVVFEQTIVIVSILVVVYFSWGIRRYTLRAIHPSMATVNSTMLMFAVIVSKLVFKFSALHFFWLFPICIMVAFLSRNINSFISTFGWIFARMCCIGLNQKEMAKNASKQKHFQELLKAGFSSEEARGVIMEKEKKDVGEATSNPE